MGGWVGRVWPTLRSLPSKVLVETLAFGHLHLDVTVPRVTIFRDAILDLFLMELGDVLSSGPKMIVAD